MRKKLFFSITFAIMITIFSTSVLAQESIIPQWIKNTAGWWSDGLVSDQEYINSLQFLIDRNILVLDSDSKNDSENNQDGTSNDYGSILNDLSKRGLPDFTYDAEKEVALPFYNLPDKDFIISKTYYVATNEPGASNTACDGFAPTNEGGGHCPFKDFNDDTRWLLFDVEGVKMVVREGTYVVKNIEDGITINGKGDEFHPVILTGYPGEKAIITPAEGVDSTIGIFGKHVIVENLAIQRDTVTHIPNTGRWNIFIEAEGVIIRNNILKGPVHQDSIKIGISNFVFIFNNDISGYGSQSVDSFGDNVLIKKNIVHDAIGKGNAFGTKGGTLNYTVVDNVIHDLEGGLSFGGTGTLSKYKKDASGKYLPAATNAVALGNTFYNINKTTAIHFQFCKDCTFEDNTVYDSVGGVIVGIGAVGCEYSPPGFCDLIPRTSGATIRNNHFANMTTGIALVEEDAKQGFISEGNTYYIDTEPSFFYKKQTLTHQQFQQEFQTDFTSITRPLSEFKP